MPSSPFGRAPQGVDLTEDRSASIIGASSTLCALGTLAVIFRFMARRSHKDAKAKYAIDDYLILAALVFSWGTALCCFISVHYGNGRHVWAVSTGDFVGLWQIYFADVSIYATAVTVTKLSIILFYYRIFQQKRILIACTALSITYWVIVVVIMLGGCQPLSFFWTKHSDPKGAGAPQNGYCLDMPRFILGNGIAAMLIDVVILVCPIPTLWKLKIPQSQRFAVVSIMLLGGIVCIASICRIVAIGEHVKSKDLTWTVAPVLIWSCVEPFVGIICACLPTFAPLMRRWLSNGQSTYTINGTVRTISYQHAPVSPTTPRTPMTPNAKGPLMSTIETHMRGRSLHRSDELPSTALTFPTPPPKTRARKDSTRTSGSTTLIANVLPPTPPSCRSGATLSSPECPETPSERNSRVRRSRSSMALPTPPLSTPTTSRPPTRLSLFPIVRSASRRLDRSRSRRRREEGRRRLPSEDLNAMVRERAGSRQRPEYLGPHDPNQMDRIRESTYNLDELVADEHDMTPMRLAAARNDWAAVEREALGGMPLGASFVRPYASTGHSRDPSRESWLDLTPRMDLGSWGGLSGYGRDEEEGYFGKEAMEYYGEGPVEIDHAEWEMQSLPASNNIFVQEEVEIDWSRPGDHH